MRLFAPFAVICWTAAATAAEPVQTTQGVDLTLLSEKSKIAPGEVFTVGLKIHHHAGFHTYWQGPGIAGVPTTLKWSLPAGFTTGPAQWPAPEQTMMSIHPVHGYERDVMLLTNLTAPADLKPGPLTLKANAIWMACADGCYPGNEDLSLELTAVAAKEDATDAATAEAFKAARKEVPQPLTGWTMELTSPMGGKQIRLHVAPAEGNAARPQKVYFFSEDGQISSEPPQTVTSTSDGGFDIVAERSEFSPEKRPTLPGVLRADVPLVPGGVSFARLEPRYKDAPAGESSAAPSEVKTASTMDGECHCEEEAAAAKAASPAKAKEEQ